MDKIILHLNDKSLTKFIWENIPRLSIVTGINGAGKTQLLELIEEMYRRPGRIDDHYRGTGSIVRGGALHVLGPSKAIPWSLSIYPVYYADEVIHLTSEWKLSNCKLLNVKALQKIKQTLYNSFLKQDESDLWWKNKTLYQVFNHVKTVLRKPNSQISFEEFLSKLPDFFYYGQEDLTHQISIIFYEYHLRKTESKNIKALIGNQVATNK